MSTTAIGLLLATAASLALNGSFLLQHLGSVTAPAVTVLHPLRTVHGLLSARPWVLGLALGMGGWAMHVAALARAPLSLVQAFVAGGLAFTVPAARRWLRRPMPAGEVAGVLSIAAALGVLGAHLTAPGGQLHFSSTGLAAFLAACGALAGILAVAAERSRRPSLLAAAGGVLYGLADLAIKVLTGAYADGGSARVLSSPWLIAALLSTAGAFFAFQRALQQGRTVAVIALMTAGTYVVSIAGGVAVLGDDLGHGVAATVLHAAALLVVVVAACALAGSQADLALGRRRA